MRDEDEEIPAAAPIPEQGPFEREIARNLGSRSIEVSEMDMEAPHMDEAQAEEAGQEEDAGKGNAPICTPKLPARPRARRTRFLATLRQTGNLRMAFHQAGICKRTAYNWRREEQWFREQWEEALEDFAMLADMAAKRMALEGIRQPIIHQGVTVGYKTEISEKLLLRMNERLNPETWGPADRATKVEHSGEVQRSHRLNAEQAAERARSILPGLIAQEAARMVKEGRAPGQQPVMIEAQVVKPG